MKISNKKAPIIAVVSIALFLATIQINRLAAQSTTSPPAAPMLTLDDEKKMLEVEKYKAEIRKLTQDSQDHGLSVDRLTAEIDKLRSDRYIAWGSAGAIILSFFGVIATILFQRKTALDVQSRSEQTNFELKVADFVMSSYSGAVADQRLKVLTRLYGDRLRPGFADDFQKDLFPSIKYQELRLALFTSLVEKCNTQDDVLKVFQQVFPEEGSWWFDKLFPPKVEHNQLVRSQATVQLSEVNNPLSA